eukprot:121706_1
MSQTSKDFKTYNAVSDTNTHQQSILPRPHPFVYQANAAHSVYSFNPYSIQYPFIHYQSPHVVPMVTPKLIQTSHQNNNRTNSHHDVHRRNQNPKSSNHKHSQSLVGILQTSDIINWPLSKDLLELKRKHNHDNANHLYNKICRTNTGIKGLYGIGKHMWLENAVEHTKHHKVKARSFVQFMEWIPKQHKQYLKSWKCYAHSSLTSDQELAQMLQNARVQKNGLRVVIINAFRKRLLAFMNAIKTLYIANKNKKERETCMKCGKLACPCYAKQYANKKKKKRKLMREVCTRCGKRTCPCYTKQYVNGKRHNMHRLCWFCNNSLCSFNHPATMNEYIITEDRPLKKRKTNAQPGAGVNETKAIKKERETYKNGKVMVQNEDTKAEKVVQIMQCANCNMDLSHKDLWRCSECKTMYYCGKQCQLRHWQMHKSRCGTSASNTQQGTQPKIKSERVSVNDWSCYSIIYWFNRLYDGKFSDMKYLKLKKDFVIGKVKGCDLMSINAVGLRMMGIYDRDEQEMILHAMADVVTNDDYDNVFANTSNTDVIPCDTKESESNQSRRQRRNPPVGVPDNVCWDYWNGLKCDRNPCKFAHVRRN